MLAVLLGIFIIINLLIRVPIRIALIFNRNNKKLLKVDFFAFIATGIVFIALIFCALIEGELESGLAIACFIVFGGLLLLIIVPATWSYIKDKGIFDKKHPLSTSTKINRCSKCGNRFNKDSLFCDKCGEKINKTIK